MTLQPPRVGACDRDRHTSFRRNVLGALLAVAAAVRPPSAKPVIRDMRASKRRLPAHTLLALAIASASASVRCGGGDQSRPGIDAGMTQRDAGGAGDARDAADPTEQAFLADFCQAVAPCCATNGFSDNLAMCQATLAASRPRTPTGS